MRNKTLIAFIITLLSSSAFGATYVPPQLINPSGSISGQAIISNGPSVGPTFGTVGIAGGGTGATTALGATSNIQFQQGGTGATSRSVQSKLSDIVSVLDYGAKCDGSTDDTTKFTNALNSFGSNGGTLLLPPGTCVVSSITAPIGVTIAGRGIGSTTLATNSTTGNMLTFSSTGGGLRDIQLASTVTRTSGAYVTSQSGITVVNVASKGHFVGFNISGASSSALAVNPSFTNINMFLPATGAGSAAMIFQNYSNAVVKGSVITGTPSGQQPDYGLVFKNGDTAFVSDTNVTRNGYALAIIPGGSENNYSFNASNDDFDSAGQISGGVNAASCLIQPTGAGNIYEAHFTSVWCGLAAGDGATIGSTGTGFIDGMHWVAGLFDGNGGSGFHITSNVKNWSAIGGHAAGNGGAGYYVSAASTDWRIIGVQGGPVSQRGSNTSTGINVGVAASNNYVISHNDVCGNAGGTIFDGGTGTNKYITQNSCYNPLNGTVSVGASPFTWTNSTGAAVTAIVTGGAVSSITLGGSTVAASTNTSIAVPPGQAIVITYSSAPTLSYKGF